ncbi:MAG: hypothetical protein ACC628_20915 [Pirellulaceae bacterium]
MWKRFRCTLLIAILFGQAAGAAEDAPWWKQQKMRVMWGQWPHAREDKSADFWGADLPRHLFRNIASAGETVFVEIRWYKPTHTHAQYAPEFGMKYFATLFISDLRNAHGKQRAITDTGELSGEKRPWCPLDQTAYENVFVEPHLEGARQGIVDGIHVDWERYGGAGEAEICYCDDCFSNLSDFKKAEEELPEKSNRFAWVTERDLVDAYKENFSQRRFEMFSRIGKKLRAAKPDLLFSSYGTLFSDFTRAMNTPATPFIFLDSRHYANNDKQPWWESYSTRLREEGYLYIPGGWTNGLFSAQASQVSAARWIYEASINEDGVWLWFERELDDEILRAYATADREIRAVQAKVENFLFNGERDAQLRNSGRVDWMTGTSARRPRGNSPPGQ